ncbi:MAG: ABC transporter ATP-binding protein [bacterium]
MQNRGRGIVVEGVHVSLGGKEILHGIDLDIMDGEVFFVVGPSGCGKTTLLRTLAGLERPTQGKIYIRGEDMTLAPPNQRGMSMVFQNYALMPHLNVEENIGFPLRVRDVKRPQIRERVRDKARDLGMHLIHLLPRYPREISMGHQQRTAMGRATIHNPRILLLDEPLSVLDAQVRERFRVDLKRRIREMRTTVICVTSDEVEAFSIADRVAVMKDGTIEQVGTPREIYDSPKNAFVAGFFGQPSMNFFRVNPDLRNNILHHPSFILPIPQEAKRKVEGRSKVILGVRPIDVSLLTGEKMRHRAIGARVIMVEHLTSRHKLVHLTIGESPCIAETFSHTNFSRGEEVEVNFDPSRLHFFEDDSSQTAIA